MKRSFLMSALVLALVAAMPACGGGGGSGEGAKTEGDAKQEGGESGDPVADLKTMSDGLQKEVDNLMQPFKEADATIDGVSKLPADLKAKVKGKFDPKKLMAEAKKLTETGDYDIKALGLEADGEALAKERFDKLKDLVTSVKTVDEKVKGLSDKIVDSVTKAPALVGKGLAKAEITLKNPLAGGDAKKKAEEDKKTLTGIGDSFKTKLDGWKTDVTGLPAKAKEIPPKFAKAFK